MHQESKRGRERRAVRNEQSWKKKVLSCIFFSSSLPGTTWAGVPLFEGEITRLTNPTKRYTFYGKCVSGKSAFNSCLGISLEVNGGFRGHTARMANPT